jgi:hypothetical protein
MENGTSNAFQYTRTPSKSNSSYVYYLSTAGNATTQAPTKSGSYRPAFTLPASAVVNPQPNADGSYTLIE